MFQLVDGSVTHRRVSAPLGRAITALALATCAGTAAAQTVTLPSGAAPGQAIGFGALSGPFTPVDPNHPLPVAGRAEGFALAAANSAAAAVSVSGGDYILAQQCAAYGTVTLRGRGPDGASMVPLLTLSAADTGGGSGVTLGAGAVVDLVLSGTTGCNATLTRVP